MANLLVLDPIEHSLGIEINTIVVKIASRCNLNCDYCYMYQHVDQSFKKQPRFMSHDTIIALARQIKAYLEESELKCMRVCLHGGEPLTAGFERIEALLSILKDFLGDKVGFSIQTNGVLLKKKFLDLFKKYDVKISLSLDGPKKANDKHRLDFKGHSSYEKVEQAMNLLTNEYGDLFVGIISVIDPTNNPEEIIDFFGSINPPSYDLLLPDATHLTPPPGKMTNPNLYVEWICRAFTHWYLYHPYLQTRTFLNLCDGVLGNKPESELFGNGSISYIVVETDGSYHYSDMLKVAYEGASHTGLFVDSSTIMKLTQSPAIQKFQSFLRQENKCQRCLQCPEYRICGSGQIIHRYNSQGFNNPSVYCEEMFSMIRRARYLVFKSRIDVIYKHTEIYGKEFAEALINDQSIYLLAKVLEKDLPSDIDSIESDFLFSNNDPRKNRKKIKNQIKLMTELFKLIKSIFPYLYREIRFFIHKINFICSEENQKSEIFFSLKWDRSQATIFCYLPDSENIPIMEMAFSLIKAYLMKKFQLIFNSILLFKKFDAENLYSFNSVYVDCYIFRIYQIFTENEPLKNKKKSSDFLKNLIKKIDSLRLMDLSEIGKKVLEELAKEFIPYTGKTDGSNLKN
jgi:radical SAM/SPASM domain FxsB family protein